MFYYINQPSTPSFPTGLVKTESDFIVRSVETGLGRSRLVVAAISADANTFLAFSDMTCHLVHTETGVFVALCHLIVRRPNLEVVIKRLLHQHVKLPGQFYCHVRAWKCVPTAISGGTDISKIPGCHLLWQMSFQGGSQKLLQGLVSHELTAFLFLTYFISMNYGHIIKTM